ncbi:hypothetical protein GC089_01680 [Cellulomonas sp. JZ18]|uniref:hypothetical protein n=1 Tax=Cellulomonas sp. JZ18 TaxID=2654191 RepID=UPI0012D45D35|nr:hypothetical protein [Cellulomonas sp. JZ18]QGQ18214.1 hypothetical protein GC089_01680 [Cellulomonas sp. JZ18]
MPSDPRTIAPHVDAAWRERLVLELRLRDVPGSTIGGALAEVEAHCVDSGQDAATAFGDPAAYAATLAEAVAAPVPRRWRVRAGVETLVQVGGVVATTWALPPWLRGEALSLTAGFATTVLVLTALAVAAAVAPGPLLRSGRRLRAWQSFLVGLAPVAVVAAATLLLPEEALRVPPAPFAVVGLVLLAAGSLALLSQGRGVDLLTAPGRDAAQAAADERRSRRLRRSAALVVPALTLAAVAMLAALPR